ncbi:ferredoxin--NADP reductase [Smaragdicoccus niigatensis]|uniref:ferredoxin--NADP reductase n=1 Tax=Smaragdicoccus niigatensis TaxID=359359 RepID=UPI000AB585EC|nr:ferredoxin--NADP reductase [Smaragdicoccus niigatensis]
MINSVVGRLPGLASGRRLVGRVNPFREHGYLIARPNGPSKRWGQSATAIAQHHVRVVDVVRETTDAVTLILEDTGSNKISFRAGQYLTHCFGIGSDIVKRAYSISTREGDHLACTIKAVDGGRVSQFVNGNIAVGYEYTVLGPSGDFELPADPDANLAFLAAGSGITPVISLIETALHTNPQRSVRLLYGSRRQSEIIFGARLAALEEEYPHFSVFHVLSQPSSGWSGETGRLTGERVAKLLSPGANTHVFLCGPADLMDSSSRALRDAGITADRIHSEKFYAAPKHTSAMPTEPQQLLFQKSGKHAVQKPGETILDAGLRNSVKLDFSCTVGGCAHCKVRVLEGDVTVDEPNCLTDAEKADGYVLTCSAYANTSAVLDA